MKKRALLNCCTALLLSLSLLLSLAACGNQARATTMHLKHTEGTVAVSDDAGEDVPLLEDLGLYSGYGVDTRSSSFAWINLDDVKLTKMDENSEIAIQKEDKFLEIEVRSGSLFFNVTEPLEDDETMNIRTSTMLVGIRGTCGWVEVPDPAHMNVYLLEGRIRCETEEEQETVTAGEMAVMAETGEITVTAFTAQDIPAFVMEEIEGDDDLMRTIPGSSGIDASTPPDSTDAQPSSEQTGLLDAYVGTYTVYDNYSGYRDVTMDAGGVFSGGGTDYGWSFAGQGENPSSITENADGSITLDYTDDGQTTCTIYPPGVMPDPYADMAYWQEHWHMEAVNLRFLDLSQGGVTDLLYYAAPASLGVSAAGSDEPVGGQTELPFTEELDMSSYTGAGGYHAFLRLQPDGSFAEGYYERQQGENHEGRFGTAAEINDHTWSMTVEEMADGSVPVGTEYRLYGPGTPLAEIPDFYRTVVENQDRAGYQVLSENQRLTGYVICNMADGRGYSTFWGEG